MEPSTQGFCLSSLMLHSKILGIVRVVFKMDNQQHAPTIVLMYLSLVVKLNAKN